MSKYCDGVGAAANPGDEPRDDLYIRIVICCITFRQTILFGLPKQFLMPQGTIFLHDEVIHRIFPLPYGVLAQQRCHQLN